MALSRREGLNISGCHYLDGMPVKISEKFKPPRKITLPLSYQQHYPVNLLNEEYDFSLENEVLELAMTKRRGREVAERAKVEKLGDSIEQFTRMASSDHSGNNSWEKKEDDCTKSYPGTNTANGEGLYLPNDPNGNSTAKPTGDSNNGHAVGIATSLLTSLEPNSMLKPVPSSSEPLTVSDKPDVTLISKFNLEDFEAESSPFDNVALKTLNDIEELKSVLQNAHLSESGNGNGDQQTEHNGQDAIAEESSRFSRFSRQQDEHHAFGSSATNVDSIPSTVSQSGNVPHPHHHSRFPGFVFEPSVLSTHLSQANCEQNLPCESCCAVTPGEPNVNAPLAAKASPEEDIYTCVLPLLNSRSTPDLLRELGLSLANEREKKKNAPSSIQPKRSGALGPPNANASEQNDNHSLVGKDSETTQDDDPKKSCARPSAHNPNCELDAEAQQLVGHIADMGFPRAKVRMVVQHVGKDDKKVVEHLCLMQTFIERGYIADDVDTGILFYGNNETQVKEYLETMIQFRDLGFDNESINKALVRCEHDREKALDLLLS